MGSSIIEEKKEREKKGILTPLFNQTVKVIDMRVPGHTLLKSTSLFSRTFASIYDFLLKLIPFIFSFQKYFLKKLKFFIYFKLKFFSIFKLF